MSDALPRLSSGTRRRTSPIAHAVAKRPSRNVTTRPPSRPDSNEPGAQMPDRTEYTKGSAGPCVKKKSR